MGLASALSTALTGLAASETTIDVVGNNLANSNTVGFKASSAYFATQFSQTQSLGSQPTDSNGGTNPRQLGLGTMVAEIRPDFTPGTIEASSNSNDLAIQGDGFFMVQGGGTATLYTRNGVFSLNSQNELVSLNGDRLLGYGVDADFAVDTTQLVPITIPLGVEVVAQATHNAYLEGTLSPTGDVATTAQVIQTGELGDAVYSAPTSKLSVSQSLEPSAASLTSLNTGTGSLVAGETYEYRVVFASEAFDPGPPPATPPLSEGLPSEIFSATVAVGDDSLRLDGLPTDATGNYDYLNIYRRISGASDFQYVTELAMGAGSYVDGTAEANLGPALDETSLTGNYTYYVTFEKNGVESRPSPISDPLPVTNGRIVLTNLPTADPAEWDNMRIYRNLSTDSSDFHLVAEIPEVDNPTLALVDNISDTELATNPSLDLDGPRIVPSTLLVNVLQRDGANYNHLFEEGVLDFTGSKGGRSLETQHFTVTSTSTVQDLIDFMQDAMGIQTPSSDPLNPIPSSSPPDPPAEPGGAVTSDGRIVITGNNGVDNAVNISTSGFLLHTSSGTENVNLPWQVTQQAVGESASTDMLVYDSLGIPIQVHLTMVMESRDGNSTTFRWFADSRDNDPAEGSGVSVGTGLLSFDGEGNLVSTTNNTVSIERRNVSSVSPLEFDLDFSGISGLAADGSNIAVSRQDGSAPGVLSSYIVGEDGTIQGVFSNGVTRELGQITLARFANPAGLEQRGQNLFAAGVNSGLPVVGNPGEQGIGTLVSGAIELSNTDIGGSLIDLILASTMYRGNSRVITTVQQMIDELLNLRR